MGKEMIQSQKPSAETISWDEYFLEKRQETPERIEDAAKFLATIISLVLSLFIAIYKNNLLVNLQMGYIRFVAGALIFSLISLLVVMIPFKYPVNSYYVDSIKQAHIIMVSRKYWAFIFAAIVFTLALIVLVINIFF